jgi:Tetratricopeptide repeat
VDATKTCPFCAEPIPVIAVRCPFCRSDLPAAPLPPPVVQAPPPPPPKPAAPAAPPSAPLPQIAPRPREQLPPALAVQASATPPPSPPPSFNPPPAPAPPPAPTSPGPGQQPAGGVVGVPKRTLWIFGALAAGLLVVVIVLVSALSSRKSEPTATADVQKTPQTSPTAPIAAPSPSPTAAAPDLQGAAEANRRGATLSEERRYQEAVQAFDEAVRLDPKLTGAWANRAHALIRLGKLDEAVASANKALELSNVPKTRAVAHLALGLVAARRGNLKDAEAAYQEALAERFDYVAAQDALQLLKTYRQPSAALVGAAKIALAGQPLPDSVLLGLSRTDKLVLVAAPRARHGLSIEEPSIHDFYYTMGTLGVPLKEDPSADPATLTADDQANAEKVRQALAAESRATRKRK